MKIRNIIFMVGLFYSAQSFALFCPTNFSQINIGDTMQTVEAACGKGTEKKHTKTDNVPQEWTYYTKMNPTDEGSIKVTFAFVDGKVANMTSNGIGIGATSICGGNNLQLATSLKDVEKACGKPALITKTNLGGDDDKSKAIEVIEWTYDGPPVVTLVFENGIFKERK